MYELRSRRGIHETKLSEDNSKQRQAKELRSTRSSSSRKKYHSDSDEEPEIDVVNENTNENLPEHNKIRHIYPVLPKEEIDVLDQERIKFKRETVKEKSPKLLKKSKPSGIINYITLIVIVLAALIGLGYMSIMTPTNSAVNCEPPMCFFQDKYKNLRNTFVSQEKLSWKIIGSAISSVVNKTDHTHPAVILLVANKDAKIISSCIANYLASYVALSYGNSLDYPKIQNKKSISSENMTKLIHTTFKESFERENHHVILLENLDTFSADTAMALHFFCDHENAPYKNIIIILTIIVDFPIDKELSSVDMHNIAQNYLDQTWEYELKKEKRAALLSRITGSVAVIHTEKNVPSVCHK